MNHVSLYILAGGRSSRFGSDKARAMLENEPLICRVRRLVGPVASAVTVVADQPDKYADLGLRTIADHHGGLGPLAGLQSALLDLPDDEDWLLMCSCDAVVIEPRWIERLLAAREEGCDAAAFRGHAHWQPMPALYARSALPHIENQLAKDRRSMQQLLAQLRTVALPQPSDWPETWQVNTPGDLENLERRRTGR